jgi:hypothetical protein
VIYRNEHSPLSRIKWLNYLDNILAGEKPQIMAPMMRAS